MFRLSRLKYCFVSFRLNLTLSLGGITKKKLVFLLKRHKLGGLLIVGGSMLNGYNRGPNNSKLLQLVGNIM